MKLKGLRWWVLSLIVLVTIINYLDRGTLNFMWVANTKLALPITDSLVVGKEGAQANEDGYLLAFTDSTTLQVTPNMVVVKENKVEYTKRGGIAYDLGIVSHEMSTDEATTRAKEVLAYITMIFMIAYGISQLVSGKLYDKVGTRRGFAISAILWGMADALASLAKGFTSLAAFRAMLGLGEAGPWPGTTKSNAEWFPVKERALAQGIFGAAASMGSVLAPIIIPLLYLSFGWKATFVFVGSLGMLWVIPWLIINRKGPKEHPWITKEEQKYILDGQPETKLTVDKGLSWGDLLKKRQNYSIILGRFFLDPIWWMFVTWLPMYLTEVFHLDLKEIAMSAWVPFVGAGIGSILGGWTSGRLISKGWTLSKARKTAMIIGAIIMVPSMICAALASTPLMAVICMAFILGGFQFTMTNIQTLASDLHSGKTVGSLAGLGGASAVLGVILTMIFIPTMTAGGNWVPFFIMGGALVPLSILSVFLLAGKIEPMYGKK